MCSDIQTAHKIQSLVHDAATLRKSLLISFEGGPATTFGDSIGKITGGVVLSVTADTALGDSPGSSDGSFG